MTFKVNKIFHLALSFSPILFVTVGIYIGRVVPITIPTISLSQESNRQVLGTDTVENIPATPIRLKIPAIKVDAPIEPIGLLSNDEIGVPQEPLGVGWFQMESPSNIAGNAVISGHLNQANGEDGVFANLHRLKPGDDILVDDNRGGSTTFVVRETRLYDPGYADEVFGPRDEPHLNLVTCDGTWDNNKKSYSKRLVVTAFLTP